MEGRREGRERKTERIVEIMRGVPEADLYLTRCHTNNIPIPTLPTSGARLLQPSESQEDSHVIATYLHCTP